MATTIPGLVAGQFYPAGSLYPQGLSFGTPRNWSQGGRQMYDPQYVRPLLQESGTPRFSTGKPYMGSSARGFDGQRPGAGVGVPSTMGGARPFSGALNAVPAGSFDSGQITTSIQPQPIYEPWMTQYATSQLQADQLRSADPFYAQKAFDRPGVSRSAGTLSAAMPGIARARAASRAIGAGVPMADAIANAGNVLGGQLEREQEALGYGSLYARILAGQLGFDRAQQGQGLTNLGTVGSLLAGIYGA